MIGTKRKKDNGHLPSSISWYFDEIEKCRCLAREEEENIGRRIEDEEEKIERILRAYKISPNDLIAGKETDDHNCSFDLISHPPSLTQKSETRKNLSRTLRRILLLESKAKEAMAAIRRFSRLQATSHIVFPYDESHEICGFDFADKSPHQTPLSTSPGWFGFPSISLTW